MSPKLPSVSGVKLVQFLKSLNYELIRQKGSHIRLRKFTAIGEHNITVPNHKQIAKGTLNDILSKIAMWNNISKAELISQLHNF
jgi:predicted RNA binding protein YcfA (HicA-like mRNA interferase family)